jgi:hypothetical protein
MRLASARSCRKPTGRRERQKSPEWATMPSVSRVQTCEAAGCRGRKRCAGGSFAGGGSTGPAPHDQGRLHCGIRGRGHRGVRPGVLAGHRVDRVGESQRPVAVFGSDGLPAQIDGQRVYRLADKAEWETLSGGFLLAAYPGFYLGTCPPHIGWSAATAAPTADQDPLAAGMSCYGAWLSETTSSYTNAVTVAPKSPSVEAMFMVWGGHAVVLRVHSHDPEAAECSAAGRGFQWGGARPPLAEMIPFVEAVDGRWRALDLVPRPLARETMGGPGRDLSQVRLRSRR